MKLYQKLAVPNLIKSTITDFTKSRVEKERFKIVSPESVLTDDAWLLFKSLKLTPYFVTIFQNPMLKTDYKNRILHRDVTLTSDSPIQWKSLTTGINLELSPGVNEFSWYDIGNVNEIFPPDEQIKYSFCRYLSAVTCGSLNSRGLPDDIKLLDKVKIGQKPVLVRTDIHHITSFEFTELRNGISIRFYEDSFERNFDNVCELLSPYFDN